MAQKKKKRSPYADANQLIIKCTARVLEEYVAECIAGEDGNFTMKHSQKEIHQINGLLREFKEIELDKFKQTSKMQNWLVRVSEILPMLWD